MSEVTVSVTGFVATDVTYRPAEDDRPPFAKFRVRSPRRRYDARQGWVDAGPTTFLSVNCRGRLADNVRTSVLKGQPVVVTGHLRVERWNSNQGPRDDVFVDASTLGHDLRMGTATYEQARRVTSVTPTEGATAAPTLVGDSDGAHAPADAADTATVGAAPGAGAPPTHPEDSGRDPWSAQSQAEDDTDRQVA